MTDTIDAPLEAGLFSLDVEARTVRGLLVPWGERSRTSITSKPVTFPRGDVTIPRDPSIAGLNRMHDRFAPMGRATVLEDRPEGVYAEFRIADTPEGDDYLAAPGALRRLSPEVRNMRRRADGTATAELVGAALVDEGAFASAALFSIDPNAEDASDSADDVDDTDPDDNTPDPAAEDASDSTDDDDNTPDPAPAADGPTDPETTPDENEENNVSVPNTMTGGTTRNADQMTKGDMFAAMSSLAQGRIDTATLDKLRKNWGTGEAGLFALQDVDYDGVDGVGAKMTPAQWLGEVVDGTSYVPRFAPLFTPKSLTALAMTGWRWTVKPKGGAWAGNKAPIPSNAPAVEAVSENAKRWAGGHDHAREHVDFGTPGYFEAYDAAMAEDFLRWLDEEVVLADAIAAATVIEADNPAGLTIGAAMSRVIDGAAAVVESGLIPTGAILPTADWKSILKTPQSDVLGYLNAALGLEDGTIATFSFRPSAEVANTLVVSKSAGEVYTLPGSPIRADALNIANGGIDTGRFGYGGLLVTNELGIVEVTPYTP